MPELNGIEVAAILKKEQEVRTSFTQNVIDGYSENRCHQERAEDYRSNRFHVFIRLIVHRRRRSCKTRYRPQQADRRLALVGICITVQQRCSSGTRSASPAKSAARPSRHSNPTCAAS